MYNVPEQINGANHAAVEALATMTSTAFAGMERLAALNLNTTRVLLEQGLVNSRALLTTGDVESMLSLQEKYSPPDSEKAADYLRRAYQIATETREALAKVVESQVSELNKTLDLTLENVVKTAPPGSDFAMNALRSAFLTANSAYEAMNRAAKQTGDMAEANLATAAKMAAMQRKKAA